MNKTITSWSKTPLLCAGTSVISTPVNSLAEPCQGPFMRFNVANLHAIKQIRSASRREEGPGSVS